MTHKKSLIYYIATICAFLLFALTLWLVNSSKTNHNYFPLKINNNTVYLEVAANPKLQTRGLMHRTHLKPKHGMLFIWPQPKIQCLWMKNTLITLDAAFIKADFSIDSIHTMQAQTLKHHCSRQKVKYALEMNQNWFTQHHLKINDRIDLSAILKKIKND